MTSLPRAAVLATLLVAATGAAGEMSGATARLELWRHERLQDTRATEGATLAPFTTDGCSGGMSAVWQQVARWFPEFGAAHEQAPPWEACCVTHDRAYHLGGPDPAPMASYQARLAADRALRACVVETGVTRSAELQLRYGMSAAQVERAYEQFGQAMFSAVRLGGAPCSGLPWRWGYGWAQCF